MAKRKWKNYSAKQITNAIEKYMKSPEGRKLIYDEKKRYAAYSKTDPDIPKYLTKEKIKAMIRERTKEYLTNRDNVFYNLLGIGKNINLHDAVKIAGNDLFRSQDWHQANYILNKIKLDEDKKKEYRIMQGWTHKAKIEDLKYITTTEQKQVYYNTVGKFFVYADVSPKGGYSTGIEITKENTFGLII